MVLSEFGLLQGTMSLCLGQWSYHSQSLWCPWPMVPPKATHIPGVKLHPVTIRVSKDRDATGSLQLGATSGHPRRVSLRIWWWLWARGLAPNQWLTTMNILLVGLIGQGGILCDTAASDVARMKEELLERQRWEVRGESFACLFCF